MSRQLTFLRADRPLTKSFGENLEVTPYPFCSRFTSAVVEYKTIEELFEIIQLVGAAGGALLKGHLSAQLNDEPRRNKHIPSADTSLLVIDYDRNDGFDSFDHLLQSIDPRLATTDYILQFSASAGIKTEAKLRAHAFFLLDRPLAPQILKQWFTNLNLSISRLRENTQLSKNGMALRYPLDVTINQNDKLIYVAPPALPFPDPIAERRLQLVKGGHRTYSFKHAVSVNANRSAAFALINELQDLSGLPKVAPKYGVIGEEELLLNPAQCVVTGTKVDGEFTRVNLNGGNSWAYWYWRSDPSILYNFKGELPCRLQDIDPAYYERIANEGSDSRDILALVFREKTTDTYYGLEYNEGTARLISCNRIGSRITLRDFMQQRGRICPRIIPDWDLTFDPTNMEQIDFSNRWVNLFFPSPLMANILRSDIISTYEASSFPTIERVIRHICVDDETYKHFIKWLAHIFKYRTKTQTAWIFSGTEGCVAGDTMLNLTRGKRNSAADRLRTIKDIYQKWSGVCNEPFNRSITPTKLMSHKDNHTIGFHEVYDIYESGIRPVWELTTATGRTIKATKEHPFMRPDGSFSPMEDLVLGDMVVVQGDRLIDRKGLGRNKARKTIHSIPHHPTAWQHIVNGKNYKRSHKARLVYEAEMNGLSYEDFLWIVKTDGEKAKSLNYLQDDQIVHHLDEDPTNDDLSNLAVIDKINHDRHHAKSTGLGTHPATYEAVTAIQYIGEEMTYDVTMKAPYHNYVANGFVVSNTGKGTLFHQVLTPLLGYRHSHLVNNDNLQEQYNEYLRTNIILFVDEGDIMASKSAETVLSKLRTLITDPRARVRMMRTDSFEVPSYSNLIIATNRTVPVALTQSDRRYNVAPKQDRKIEFADKEYARIPDELEAFGNFLKSMPISDTEMVNEVLKNEARERLIILSSTVADDFMASIRFGELQFFIDHLQPITPLPDNGYSAFSSIVKSWMMSAGEEALITQDDLLTVYRYVSGNQQITPKKFQHLSSRLGLDSVRRRVNGLMKLSYLVYFKTDRLDLEEWKQKNKATIYDVITGKKK